MQRADPGVQREARARRRRAGRARTPPPLHAPRSRPRPGPTSRAWSTATCGWSAAATRCSPPGPTPRPPTSRTRPTPGWRTWPTRIANAGVTQINGQVLGRREPLRHRPVRQRLAVPLRRPEPDRPALGPVGERRLLVLPDRRPTPAPPSPGRPTRRRSPPSSSSDLLERRRHRGRPAAAGTGPRPPTPRSSPRFGRAPLRDIVAQLLTWSDNQTAELLIKELGFSPLRPRHDRRRRRSDRGDPRRRGLRPGRQRRGRRLRAGGHQPGDLRSAARGPGRRRSPLGAHPGPGRRGGDRHAGGHVQRHAGRGPPAGEDRLAERGPWALRRGRRARRRRPHVRPPRQPGPSSTPRATRCASTSGLALAEYPQRPNLDQVGPRPVPR